MDLRHPQLAPATPVLRRGPGEVQVGLVPGSALVLTDVPESLVPLLTGLDGTRTVAAVLAAADPHLDRDLVQRVLDALARAGVLVEGPLSPTPPAALTGTRIRLIGAGPIGARVGRGLLEAGVSTLYLHDNAPVDPLQHPVPTAASCQAEALRGQLLAAEEPGEASRVSVLDHWGKPDRPDSTDFTVVATDGPECDRAVSDDLVRADQPHLFVRTLGTGACVGPLVVPGHGACLRCLDLARRDADPRWPTVLGQLAGIRCRVSESVTTWAATTAVTHTVAWLRTGAATTLGGTLDLSPDDYHPRLRRWAAHPRCGCCWGRAAEWGHGC